MRKIKYLLYLVPLALLLLPIIITIRAVSGSERTANTMPVKTTLPPQKSTIPPTGEVTDEQCLKTRAEAAQSGWYVYSCNPLRVYSLTEAEAMGLLNGNQIKTCN